VLFPAKFDSTDSTNGRIFIGTCGFSYRHWGGGAFYPQHLRPREWLEYYSQYFNTVEIDSTFYQLPSVSTLQRWYDSTPANFLFAVKASRFITHVQRLQLGKTVIALFLERVSTLGAKLGPILFQLPPTFPYDRDRLEQLIGTLEKQDIVPSLRCSLEVRHSSWSIPDVYACLRDTNIALCLSDHPSLQVQAPQTANFVYIRRHGPGGDRSRYTSEMLRVDARRIATWQKQSRDVYLYFNNDAGAAAVQNALELGRLLSQSSTAFNGSELYEFPSQDSV
jgi:uncharacterized protein YecE (DUF72 family)